MPSYQGIISRYPKYLPVNKSAIVTLNEGNTPLIRADRLANALKFSGKLYLKYEGLNPTASFKDRGMTYAVSKARENKCTAIICASTGNTSASAAAYAARANLGCYVLIPEGNIAYGKLAQAMIHGAKVVQIRGNFDAALKIVLEIGRQFPVEIVNSVNPYRLQGQQTAAFEVCDDLGLPPDYHFLPVGNAGNITAYWMGYKQWTKDQRKKLPTRMMGFQAAGAAPLVYNRPIKNPKTLASAIRIGNPASWQGALKARDESGGVIDKITDREIVRAYKLTAETEGVFCEPASAISVAGVAKMVQKKILKRNATLVCTLTGHGLKDPDTAIESCIKPLVCDAKFAKIINVLKL